MGKGQSKIEGSYIITNKGDTIVSDNLRTIPDCLKLRADTIPDQDAVVFYSQGEPRSAISWKELYVNSCKMAKTFIKLGVKPREPIAIVARNSPEWLYAAFGAMLAGTHITGIGLKYKDGSDLIEKMKQLQTCPLLVLEPGFNETNWAIVKQLLDSYNADGTVSSSKMPYLRHVLFTYTPKDENVNTIASQLEIDNEHIELPEIDPEDVAILFPTSGSTGMPKLVTTTHGALMRAREMVLSSHIYGNHAHYNEGPFGWIGGFLSGYMYGQKNVVMSGQGMAVEDKVQFLIDVIRTECCKDVSLGPPMIFELTKRWKELPSDWPVENLWTGGQPMSKAITSCVGKICKRLCLAYAGSEFNLGACMLIETPEDFVEYASGLPPPGVELKIVDTDGKLVPAGERGEIYVRHDWLFKEYYNDPDKTAAVRTEDGWFKTNDCGTVNPKGVLVVEGRMSDIIICGGLKVTPALLQIILSKHVAVEAAIMVPVSDDVLHQAICACVVLKSGVDVTESELREYMEKVHNEQENLVSVLPKYYMILDQFPLENTLKVSKTVLKEMANRKFKV